MNYLYRHFFKRILDIICAILVLILFGWLYIIIAILVKNNLGSPVIFKQPRPGKKDKTGQETIFNLYKFRTMTDEKDFEGNLLPDDIRLTSFGKKLRSSSLDELPEIINILKGEMSFIGPRPQLVRDMVFMTESQRHRHDIRPGLSGLAQVSGRNAISWEDKLNKDLEYLKKESFFYDLYLCIKTVFKVIKKEDITQDELATAEDFGDYLYRTKQVTREEYDEKQMEARKLLK